MANLSFSALLSISSLLICCKKFFTTFGTSKKIIQTQTIQDFNKNFVKKVLRTRIRYCTGMDKKSEAKLSCFDELDVLLLELESPLWRPKNKYIEISDKEKNNTL
jgi:hypothetical protein